MPYLFTTGYSLYIKVLISDTATLVAETPSRDLILEIADRLDGIGWGQQTAQYVGRVARQLLRERRQLF